jgi:hypothetical protein
MKRDNAEREGERAIEERPREVILGDFRRNERILRK